jgi:hypothetical protein
MTNNIEGYNFQLNFEVKNLKVYEMAMGNIKITDSKGGRLKI